MESVRKSKIAMKDLSLHFLDILENSAKAGATRVELVLLYRGTWLEFYLLDNGPGFPLHISRNPTDPFMTTRIERKAGLGLALLRETTLAAGGELVAKNRGGGGVEVRGRLDMANIDARPLGNLVDSLVSAVTGWPALDLILVVVGNEGARTTILDTSLIKQELPDVAISHPAVLRFIRESLREGLQPLEKWLEAVQDASRWSFDQGQA